MTTTFSAASPQLELDINRTMVESFGVTINDVFQTLQTYLGSTYVNQFNKFNQSFQVRVQAGADYRRELQDISNLYVANRSGQMVPLGALLDVRRMLGSELLTRYNLYPAGLDYRRPGARLQFRTSAHHDGARRQREPAPGDGLRLDRTFLPGEADRQSGLLHLRPVDHAGLPGPGRAVRELDRSGRGDPDRADGAGGSDGRADHPDFPTDLYTQIGLVLMIALAAKNAILIVEFAREIKAEGMSAVDAAVEATRRRFRPILMTSIAFILGVVPLLTATGAGAASQQSLGTVVFGGMIASTLIAIPVRLGVLHHYGELRGVA